MAFSLPLFLCFCGAYAAGGLPVAVLAATARLGDAAATAASMAVLAAQQQLPFLQLTDAIKAASFKLACVAATIAAGSAGAAVKGA